jgi:hypothetical protein
VGADRRRLACLLVPAALLLAGLELYDVLVWGTPWPAPNQVSGGSVPFVADPLPGLLGTVLDQEAGVLPNFPVLALALPGLLLAAGRRHRRLNLQVAAVALPYLLIVCSFPAWAGAWSPPARFAAVVLPLLAGYVAVAVQRAWGAAAIALTAALAGFGLLLTALAVLVDGGGFSAQGGRSPVWERLAALTHLDLVRFVPSSALGGQAVLFGVWSAAAVAFALAVWVRWRVSPPGAAPGPRPGPAGTPE